MAGLQNTRISARDRYADLYRTELDLEAAWLRYGAVEKATSVELLLARNGIHPKTLLELGCGTGAVIKECQRRKLASQFTAVDYSKEAIEYLASQSNDIHCMAADITDPAFRLEQCFDVVILSHVLEHLEEPLQFLRAMRKNLRFRYLVAEVPLEDLLASRIKNLFRDRSSNRAGHVQFLAEPSLIEMLHAAAFQVKDTRRYVPVLSSEMAEFVCDRHHLSVFQALVKRGTASYLPRLLGSLWGRVYYAHCAVLCEGADQ